MKLYLLLAASFCALSCYAQDTPGQVQSAVKPDSSEVLFFCKQMPEFPGGHDSLKLFLEQNVKYPEAFKDRGEEYKVTMRFIVSETGRPRNFELIKNSCGKTPECKPFEDEALRVLRLMPDWKPGMQDDKPVPVYFTLPVCFIYVDTAAQRQITVTYDPAARNRGPVVMKSSGETQPQFPGGYDSLRSFMSSNTLYPGSCKEQGISGKVTVRFMVGTEGWIEKIEVLRTDCYRMEKGEKIMLPDSSCIAMEKEAMRLIGSMPRWKPGTQDGKPVPVYYTLPIAFKLDEESLPEFPGGQDSLRRFFDNNLRYPPSLEVQEIEGKVMVRFLVTKAGWLEKIEALSFHCYYMNGDAMMVLQESSCEDFAKEAVRVISAMPRWKPATLNGKPVDFYCTIPVKFSIRRR